MFSSSQMQKQAFSQIQYMPNDDSLFAVIINTDIYYLTNTQPVKKPIDFVKKKKTVP